MKNMGDGRRVARVEKEVQMQIARYLISGFSTPLPGIITVSHVRMPTDLRTAKVYVSLLGETQMLEEAVNILQSRAFEIQDFIGRELKMRYCPKLTFLKDSTTEQVIKLEKILHSLKSDKKDSE